MVYFISFALTYALYLRNSERYFLQAYYGHKTINNSTVVLHHKVHQIKFRFFRVKSTKLDSIAINIAVSYASFPKLITQSICSTFLQISFSITSSLHLPCFYFDDVVRYLKAFPFKNFSYTNQHVVVSYTGSHHMIETRNYMYSKKQENRNQRTEAGDKASNIFPMPNNPK